MVLFIEVMQPAQCLGKFYFKKHRHRRLITQISLLFRYVRTYLYVQRRKLSFLN